MKTINLKKVFIMMVVFCLLTPISSFFSNGNQVSAETNWEEFKNKQDVPLNKEWVITFSDDVEGTSLTEEYIYVLDSSNQKIPTTVLLVMKEIR